MLHDNGNIMVILSSPSGVGKTTITKKYNKNTTLLKFQYPILQENLDLTRWMGWITFLPQLMNLRN